MKLKEMLIWALRRGQVKAINGNGSIANNVHDRVLVTHEYALCSTVRVSHAHYG